MASGSKNWSSATGSSGSLSRVTLPMSRMMSTQTSTPKSVSKSGSDVGGSSRKRKADTTPTGASPKRSSEVENDHGPALQETLTSLLAGQKSLGERFCKLEDQLESVRVLAESLKLVQESYEDCRHRLTLLEEKLEALVARHCDEREQPLYAANEDGHRTTALQQSLPLDQEGVWQTVHRISRNEAQKEARRDNVIVSGLVETEDENAEKIICDLVPECEPYILEATRIGKKVSNRHRRLLVKFSPRGKAIIWSKKTSLQRDGKNIYVGHDLTPAEREERQKQWPTFKKLREAGVPCSLPRATILQDGKAMTPAAIADALKPHVA